MSRREPMPGLRQHLVQLGRVGIGQQDALGRLGAFRRLDFGVEGSGDDVREDLAHVHRRQRGRPRFAALVVVVTVLAGILASGALHRAGLAVAVAAVAVAPAPTPAPLATRSVDVVRPGARRRMPRRPPTACGARRRSAIAGRVGGAPDTKSERQAVAAPPALCAGTEPPPDARDSAESSRAPTARARPGRRSDAASDAVASALRPRPRPAHGADGAWQRSLRCRFGFGRRRQGCRRGVVAGGCDRSSPPAGLRGDLGFGRIAARPGR